MTRVYLVAACMAVGVVTAGAVPALGGTGFVLAGLLLVLIVVCGDLRPIAAAARTPVDLRVYSGVALFATIFLVLGVSLWF